MSTATTKSKTKATKATAKAAPKSAPTPAGEPEAQSQVFEYRVLSKPYTREGAEGPMAVGTPFLATPTDLQFIEKHPDQFELLRTRSGGMGNHHPDRAVLGMQRPG